MGFSIAASGSTTESVQVTTVGTVTWGMTSVAPAPVNSTACYIGATASCDFTAALAGFLFNVLDHYSDVVQNITVSAVKQEDNSLACAPAFISTGKKVNFGCSYSNPASGTLPVTVGGSDITCDASGGVSLSFNASGVATTTVKYADVGQMSLTASYTGSGDSEAGLVMSGSDYFIAAPASFAITATGPFVAGSPFSATVTARNASGNATPNFGNETSSEGVTLTSTLVPPVGGSNPALASGTIPGSEFGASGMVSDADGVAKVTNLSWSEVGNITLNAVLTSGGYLGSVLNATGSSATTGPFIPEHFDVELVSASGVPMACPNGLTCPTNLPPGASGFVYSGQPFRVRVTAKNLGGSKTANYDDALGFSKKVTLSAWDALGSIVTQNPPTPPSNDDLLNNGVITAATFALGVATTATPTYTFGTAPTAPTDIYVRATDTDSVSSRRASSPGSSVEPGLKVASGRVKVSNAYGSELLPLTLTATAQYFGGATEGWVNSVTDDATGLTVAGTSPVGSGTTTVSPLSGTLDDGELEINLDVPTAGPGVATITPAVTGCAVPATCYLPLIQGTGTFGVYKGNNRYIYRRERY